VRDEVRYTSGLLDTCKAELAAHYQDWLRQTYGQRGARRRWLLLLLRWEGGRGRLIVTKVEEVVVVVVEEVVVTDCDWLDHPVSDRLLVGRGVLCDSGMSTIQTG